MNDFRSEAEKIYETTRDTDTRGIIAAVLHLADTMNPAAAGYAHPVPERAAWQGAALSYLLGKPTRRKTADRIASWLTAQGFEVDAWTVNQGMWQLVADGRVAADTSGMEPVFAAVRD